MSFQIKKVLGLGLAGGMALKKFGNMLLNMPRQLIRTAFKIQMEIIYFPLRVINTFYRLIFKPSNMTCNCTKTLQANSDIKTPCNKYVLPVTDMEQVSPCHKSVQANADMEQVSPCHKSVQANADMEQVSPCNKSVQANADLQQVSPCHKSVQANADLQLVYPCHKSVQANADLEQESPCDKSVQVTFDSRHKSPRRPVQTNLFSQQNLSKSVESVNKDNIKNDIDDDSFVMPEFPHAKSADFNRYSEIVKRRTLRLIDELSNLAKHSKASDSEPEIFKFSSCRKENLVRNSKSILTEDVPTIIKSFRELGCQEKNVDVKNIFQNSKHTKNNKSPRIVSNQEALGAEETHQNAQQVLHLSIEVLRSLVDIVTQEIISLKHRLASANSRIEEILKSSDSLFEELSKINERFNRLINLSNKITDLQRELGEGHKLFQEVEADRNDMQLKLQALERMIKEEEEFLDEVSCESGYDELEIRATSPHKHGYS